MHGVIHRYHRVVDVEEEFTREVARKKRPLGRCDVQVPARGVGYFGHECARLTTHLRASCARALAVPLEKSESFFLHCFDQGAQRDFRGLRKSVGLHYEVGCDILKGLVSPSATRCPSF
eukprot:scaffold159047_cov25-Tisochrysis_lutea.AAC.2